MIMNMPIRDNNASIMWDISAPIFTESEIVSTLPRNVDSAYVVKLNDIFYMKS